MLRLLYISDALEGLTDDSIDAILKSAAKNNPPLGITGLLVFGGGLFTQVLEGPEQNVLKKYVQVMSDPRHRNCRIVYITPTEERIFKDISMAHSKPFPGSLSTSRSLMHIARKQRLQMRSPSS